MTPGRTWAWVALAALVSTLTAWTALNFKGGPDVTRAFQASIGGPFRMTTHDGRVITDKDLRGKPFAIFFGFTQCPDVCPTTMLEVARLLELLGPDADKIRFLFVTVDPERDTADLLKHYLSSFDKRIIGLRGTAEDTAELARAYRVFYSKVPTKESYTINHTATMYVMNAEGRFAKSLAFGEDEKVRLRKIKDVLGIAERR